MDNPSSRARRRLAAVLAGGIPDVFLQALRSLNDFSPVAICSRVAICGLIASYEVTPTALPDMRLFLARRIKIEGYIVCDRPALWPEALRALAGLAAAKNSFGGRRSAMVSKARRRRWSICRMAAISEKCSSGSIEARETSNGAKPELSQRLTFA
jgi:hypothetical protein